ncbi:DMT family transporter [Wandonia haliotis]|uniref:DMT family transporter n=1 Tax=Wandonia haliotis TaxID=574963 RepID=A0ABN1MNA1_9FLAO
MKTIENLWAHLALLTVNLIYGANYVLAKDIMPDYILPNGLILIRVAGATLLLWIVRLFIWEKVNRKDLILIAFCALFGVSLNQLFFFNGLNLTSPINSSIIMTSNPIMVVILAFFLLKERIQPLKITGVIVGTFGAVWLILLGNPHGSGTSSILGDIYIFINSLTYALYLVLVKPLMSKYKPITVITLVFTFGLGYIMLYPPVWTELRLVDFSAIPAFIYWEIAFVIVAVTFLAYLLNIFALKIVSPSIASSYIYLQPVFAGVFAWLFMSWLKADYVQDITLEKVFCSLLIALGVYLISVSSKKQKRLEQQIKS